MFDQKPQPDNSPNPPSDLPISGNIPQQGKPIDLYQKVASDNSSDNMQFYPRNSSEPEDILGDVDTDNDPASVQRPSGPVAGFGATIPSNIPPRSIEATSSTGGKKTLILVVAVIVVLLLIGVAGVMAYQLFMATPTNQPNQGVNQNINSNTNQNTNQQQVIFDEPEEPAEPIQPALVDSDGDGLNDDEEKIYGTNISSVDTDADGLTDRDEIEVFSTDPLNPDTDGDGYNDGEEVRAEYDPKGPGVLFGTERQQ